MLMIADEAFDAELPYRQSCDTVVDIRLANTLDDFMTATALMRIVAANGPAPLACEEIGGAMARLSLGECARESGALLLAVRGDDIVGFALLRPAAAGPVELGWMHAPADGGDGVADALWVAALGMLDEWACDESDMSAFVTEAIAARKARPLN